MALTNTSLPEHLSTYSPPDFTQHFEKQPSPPLSDPSSDSGSALREKASFNESLLRSSGTIRNRHSTSSTKVARTSILTFAALARDKTNSAIASFTEPTLRTRASGNFPNDLYTNQSTPQAQSSSTSHQRRASIIPQPPVQDYRRSSTLDLKTSPISTQPYKDTVSNTPPPHKQEQRGSSMHQTSSRLLRMTDDDRPFTRVSDDDSYDSNPASYLFATARTNYLHQFQDFKDLFSTLVVSLPLESHRRFLNKCEHSFLSEEAINNLGSLKFSQSNRMPDPKDPSRIVTTTTTTTFSMARDMARTVCQRFVDARFIESADGKQQKEFTLKGTLWQLTPKGIFVLDRFCQRNGIQQKHVQDLINNTSKNTTQLVILERDPQTDAISSDAGTVEVLFRRFIGANGPNIKTSLSQADSDSLSEYKDGLQGVRMAHERKVGSPQRTVYETFTGKAAVDWLMDCCTTVDRSETLKIATAFVEHELIWCVHLDRSYSATYPNQKFQPTKLSFWQMTQKGKDVVSNAHNTRISNGDTESPSQRVGVSRDSNTQKLDKILTDAALRLLFREQLRETHCEENLSFYLDVDEFLKSCAIALKNLNKVTSQQKKNEKDLERVFDAIKETMASAYGIYNAFLAPGSPCELNIDHLLRQQLAQRMTKSVGQKDAMIDSLREVIALFEQAQLSVFKLMASVRPSRHIEMLLALYARV